MRLIIKLEKGQKIKFQAWAVILSGLNNVCYFNRNFPPEIGGMQNLIGGLANALVNHGPVKVFADKTEK